VKNKTKRYNSFIFNAWALFVGHLIKKINYWRVRLAIILTACGMLLEFMGGFISNSLSLISDAGHMLTHLFALGMSYFAILLSLRPTTKNRPMVFIGQRFWLLLSMALY